MQRIASSLEYIGLQWSSWRSHDYLSQRKIWNTRKGFESENVTKSWGCKTFRCYHSQQVGNQVYHLQILFCYRHGGRGVVAQQSGDRIGGGKSGTLRGCRYLSVNLITRCLVISALSVLIQIDVERDTRVP